MEYWLPAIVGQITRPNIPILCQVAFEIGTLDTLDMDLVPCLELVGPIGIGDPGALRRDGEAERNGCLFGDGRLLRLFRTLDLFQGRCAAGGRQNNGGAGCKNTFHHRSGPPFTIILPRPLPLGIPQS